jgi:hypothetical protein
MIKRLYATCCAQQYNHTTNTNTLGTLANTSGWWIEQQLQLQLLLQTLKDSNDLLHNTRHLEPDGDANVAWETRADVTHKDRLLLQAIAHQACLTIGHLDAHKVAGTAAAHSDLLVGQRIDEGVARGVGGVDVRPIVGVEFVECVVGGNLRKLVDALWVVVGAQQLDGVWMRNDVAAAHRCQAEGLGERACHNDVGQLHGELCTRDQALRLLIDGAKLVVRLVDQEHNVVVAMRKPTKRAFRPLCAGRVVGRHEVHQMRLVGVDLLHQVVLVVDERIVVGGRHADQRRTATDGIDAKVLVCRHRRQHRLLVAEKRVAHENQRIVGAVGDQQVLGNDIAVARQLRAQLLTAGQVRIPLEQCALRRLHERDQRRSDTRRWRNHTFVPVELQHLVGRQLAVVDLDQRRGRLVRRKRVLGRRQVERRVVHQVVEVREHQQHMVDGVKVPQQVDHVVLVLLLLVHRFEMAFERVHARRQRKALAHRNRRIGVLERRQLVVDRQALQRDRRNQIAPTRRRREALQNRRIVELLDRLLGADATSRLEVHGVEALALRVALLVRVLGERKVVDLGRRHDQPRGHQKVLDRLLRAQALRIGAVQQRVRHVGKVQVIEAVNLGRLRMRVPNERLHGLEVRCNELAHRLHPLRRHEMLHALAKLRAGIRVLLDAAVVDLDALDVLGIRRHQLARHNALGDAALPRLGTQVARSYPALLVVALANQNKRPVVAQVHHRHHRVVRNPNAVELGRLVARCAESSAILVLVIQRTDLLIPLECYAITRRHLPRPLTRQLLPLPIHEYYNRARLVGARIVMGGG